MGKGIPKHMACFAVCVILLGLCACQPTENPSEETEAVYAKVIEIEKYGHALLDLTTADLSGAGYQLGDVVSVQFGDYAAQMPFYDGYYTNPGEVLLRGGGPESHIALCLNYENFAQETGIAIGDTVKITMAEKGGMLAYQELCALRYSSRREDYADDAVFANFRAVTAGAIGDGKLYRSASPIDNTYGRAGYAEALMADAGVVTALNLADSPENIEAFCKEEDFRSPYYLSLWEAGNVMALDMGSDFFSKEFAARMAEGFGFLARKDPPYCIHCSEGKDRTGITAVVLEALMGAELQEIIDDYMASFYNYYGVHREKEPERYAAVLNNNLIPMLYHITGTDSMEALAQADLAAAAADYLRGGGMAEADIRTLQEKLR